MTRVERSLRARIGACSLHAQRDASETTSAARAAFLSRFEREVDPDGELAPEERARRAERPEGLLHAPGRPEDAANMPTRLDVGI
jgi:hypothetical protein